MARLLLTGFEPFGGRTRNPALALVERLDEAAIGPIGVVARPLPVVFSLLKDRLTRLLAETRPDAVILTGLAATAPHLRLEQFAINCMSPEVPDNAGVAVTDQPLEPHGPAGRRATVDLAPLATALTDAGIPARQSFHAGTHCCNASLYHLLGLLEATGQRVPAFFLHLPCLPEMAAEPGGIDRDRPSMPLEMMEQAIRILAPLMLPVSKGKNA